MSLIFLSNEYLIGLFIWVVLGIIGVWVLMKGWVIARRRNKGMSYVKTGLFLWMMLFMLTLVELYFALFFDSTDSFNMTNVSKKWFEKHIHPYEQGLPFSDGLSAIYRDSAAFPTNIPEDQHHIMFVGDSFTFGHGLPNVEHRFSNRLRAELDQDHPNRFAVSNISNVGKDLLWCELLLNHVFDDGHKVDTVIYVMCLNDIETFDDRTNTYYDKLAEHNPKFFLFTKTYFFNMLYFRVKQYTLPDVRGYYQSLSGYFKGKAWERMQAKIKELDELCKKNNAELNLVVFPFLHNLGPDYPFHDAHSKIASYCETQDIPVLDLESAMSEHRDENLVVNPFDAHPNPRANEIAARVIREKLINRIIEQRRNAGEL